MIDNPSVRDVSLALLRQLGLTRIFGNPGSTELPLFRDFPDDFRYVLGLRESIVVAMADGFAQATRNAALVNLHSAAGVGHALGNIFTAYKNQTPLIVTAGQQARSILPYEPFLFAQQAVECPKPYVKWAVEPARAEDVPAALSHAYHIAMLPPRGPVFVSIPADDWDRPCAPFQPHCPAGGADHRAARRRLVALCHPGIVDRGATWRADDLRHHQQWGYAALSHFAHHFAIDRTYGAEIGGMDFVGIARPEARSATCGRRRGAGGDAARRARLSPHQSDRDRGRALMPARKG